MASLERPGFTLADRLIGQFDQALKTLVPHARIPRRDNPAASMPAPELDDNDRRHAASLMRINHTGEVCAQALYQGQGLTARLPTVRDRMDRAAQEEADHLSWCEDRLRELNSRPSLLNPLWYSLSFSLGAAAGLAGDRWSLGFVAETERQVCRHLRQHLGGLPARDDKSRTILQQMLVDEGEHADSATAAGGRELPVPVRLSMKAMAKAMKTAVYRI